MVLIFPHIPLLFLLYKHFANATDIENMRKMFENGEIGYGDAKKILFDAINARLTAPREKYEYLMSHTNELDEILSTGAARAREIADKTIKRVMHAMIG
mgnify:CR=1 FL=1